MDEPQNLQEPNSVTGQALVEPRPASVASELRAIARWLHTNNPFYAASAALTFAGLRMSFDTSGSTFQTSGLLLALVVYTLLLAGAAWFLIRYASLWEDARTLLLVVVLMLLAISVSFDDTLAASSWLGIPLFIVGFVFAVGLSEGLLRAIRLRLAAGYRLPFHGMLAVFFLYPVLLSQWIREPQSPALCWGLFGFSAVAGGVFLTLLPAIRRGAEYVRDNGSPWQWPWFPWTLFVTLGLGVCIRAYYLCVSFHFVGVPQTIFALYFLVPFLWVLALLVLEIGFVTRQKSLQYAGLTVAAGLVVLGVTASPDRAFDLGFLTLFYGTLGASPLFLTLVAAIAFFLLAWLRGVSAAFWLLTLGVTSFSVCGTSTFNLDTLMTPWGLPILGTALMLLARAARHRSAAASLVGGWCAVVAMVIDSRNVPLEVHEVLILVHAMLAVVLLVGVLFRDPAGLWIQRLGAVSMVALALTAIGCPPGILGDPPSWLVLVYPLLMSSIALAYGLLVSNPLCLASATVCVSGWLVVNGWPSYQQARRSVVGLDYIVSGLVFFVVAMLVSLSKTDLLRRLGRRGPRPN